MKIIKSQKRNKKSYFVTLAVSDYDIEILESLAYCITGIDKPENKDSKISKWLRKTFWEFQKLWKKYEI